MYTYKDFVSGKPRRTYGEFVQWQRGGPLNAWGAIFKRKTSILFIPEYLLTTDAKAKLPDRPKEPTP